MHSSPYPSAVNLPFNFSSLEGNFFFAAPNTLPDPQGAVWAIMQGNNVILESTAAGLQFPESPLPAWIAPATSLVVGTWHGRQLIALTLSNDVQPQPPFVSEPFNSTRENIDIQTLTLAGLGKQMLHWERQSSHCPRCGDTTGNVAGSWGKRCRSCNYEQYPHIHPCSIILVKRGNELLLTRKAEWPAGRYSLVAGFLEFGESLEECAVREVREETGIEICNLRYIGSQNWPFPSQLMAGFVAEYAGGEIKIDADELEDARWFPSDALPSLPTRRSIARYIIDTCI